MQGKFGINIMLVRNNTSDFVGSGKQNKSKKIKGINIQLINTCWTDMNWFLCFTTLIASKILSLILYFLNYIACSAHRFNECLQNEWMNEGVTQLISTSNGRLRRVWMMMLEKKGEAIRDIALKYVLHQRNFICTPFKMEFWQQF